ILGLAGGMIMRSVLGALFVFVQAFIHLNSLASEPGHPQELIMVILAMAMLVAAWPVRQMHSRELNNVAADVRRRDLQSASKSEPPYVGCYQTLARWEWTFEVVAALGALLLFTKINIGVFFGVALLLAMRCCSDDRFASGKWRWLPASLCAALPFALMRPHLGEQWCRNYSFVTASAIIATFLLASRLSNRQAMTVREYLRPATLFLMACGLIAGVALWTGTSLRGLWQGLFLTPLKMPGVALLPLAVPNTVLINAAIALALAIILGSNVRHSRARLAVDVLKMLYGIMGACWLLGDGKAQIAWLLPWVWLVVLPASDQADTNPQGTFARSFLCLMAAWQSLQAYPIAGTQVATATI